MSVKTSDRFWWTRVLSTKTSHICPNMQPNNSKPSIFHKIIYYIWQFLFVHFLLTTQYMSSFSVKYFKPNAIFVQCWNIVSLIFLTPASPSITYKNVFLPMRRRQRLYMIVMTDHLRIVDVTRYQDVRPMITKNCQAVYYVPNKWLLN